MEAEPRLGWREERGQLHPTNSLLPTGWEIQQTTTRSRTLTKATKSAMTKALGLLEELTGSKVAATSGVRSAVAQLITAGNRETLQERHPHLTELVRQLFDWAPGTDPRATEE